MIFIETSAEEIRAMKAKYAREWREKNPGKSKEYQERYWRKKVEEQRKDENDADSAE